MWTVLDCLTFQVTQIDRSGRFLEWRFSLSVPISRSKTGLEPGNWFYTTDCDTSVCVLVVFSCTVYIEVYTCVLLVYNSWEFKEIGL